jgi:hypothetical protein
MGCYGDGAASGPDRRHLIVAFLANGDRGSVLQADLLAAIATRTDALLHIVASSMILHPPYVRR